MDIASGHIGKTERGPLREPPRSSEGSIIRIREKGKGNTVRIVYDLPLKDASSYLPRIEAVVTQLAPRASKISIAEGVISTILSIDVVQGTNRAPQRRIANL